MSDAYWKTPQEWAWLTLDGLPQTKRRMNAMAERETWQSLGSDYARKRAGRGGGWEYHLNCLPEAAKQDFLNRERAIIAQADLQKKEKSEAAIMSRVATDLTARLKQVMEARNTILIELSKRAILQKSYDRMLDEFLAEAKSGAMPAELIEVLYMASDRRKNTIPSKRSIYYWKKTKESEGVTALAPKRAPQQLKQETPEYLGAFLRYYAHPTKPTIAQALRKMAASLDNDEDAPTYDQVSRALKALKGTNRWLDAYRGREGSLQLKARLAFTRRSTEGMEPTEIYTADGKTFDAEIAHPMHGKAFKPEVTWVLDVATRKCVGWSAGLAESAEAVADALRHAAEKNGIPAIFYTDRGKGYKNKRIGNEAYGLAARLGTTMTYSLPYNSQARGLMERAHKTVLNDLARTFVTYLGKDMDRQASQKVHKQSRKELKEFGESKTLPSWAQFTDDLGKAIEEYNDRPHSALKLRDSVTGKMRRASPNEYWNHLCKEGFEPFRVQADESDDLFRPHKKASCRRCEIAFNTNRYFSIALSPFHGQTVFIGYDMHDASKIWVHEIEKLDGKEVPGRLIAHAEFAGNETRYMPKSMTDTAKETRAKGRLKRHDAKRGEILEEANPMPFIPQVVIPTPSIDMPMSEQIVEPAQHVDEIEPANKPLVFSSDVELAQWAAKNPTEVNERQLQVIYNMMRRSSGMEILEYSGVDINALRNLVKDVA